MNVRLKSFFGFLIFVSLIIFTACNDGSQSVISEKKQVIKTYPFSDPNPVPALAMRRSHIYPYFQFNQYSHDSIDEEWTVITLENDFIEVTVLPEVGGKVWGAVEKSTGLEFLYKNKVKKFRNIAVRGPWSSGGIEFNFGTAGHTPATATPVDYLIRENDDGSVSAIVGAMDLPSRTEWRVIITLPADKAFFETESFWYNTTPLKQFNYVWMNAAIKAADDLQFFFPGQYHIGHAGDAHPWPIDDEGRDLTWYKNNAFGSSKSYHILGEKAEYFGAYWHDEQFGFGNWSLYNDMPGKKLWLWALSRAGGIWEDLLTDTDGQYVEVQSGRYFSQVLGRSPETPFNHDHFPPSDTDTWKEVWFPVKEIGGIEAASPYAVLNREEADGKSIIKLMALQTLNNEELFISVNEELIKSSSISLQPLEVYYDTLDGSADTENMRVILGDNKLIFNSNKDLIKLDRPVENDLHDNLNSTARIYHRGVNQLVSRNYAEALENFLTVIENDPAFTKAYVNLADLYYRRGEYHQALEYASEALSHNTFDDEANFMYGVIQKRLGNTIQAIEAFGWAARSPQYRSPAYDLMAAIYLKTGRTDLALEFAKKALVNNQININAHKALAVGYRKNQETQKALQVLDTLLELDPLNHFARFERYLLNKNQSNRNSFTSFIRNELPHETYLELAIYYVKTGQTEDAIELLQLAPPYPMVYYWLAYLHKDHSGPESENYLQQALESSPEFVFPFRLETIPVLEWAMENSNSWKNNYYTGLIYWYAGQDETAISLFNQAEETSGYSPFYMARGELKNRLGYPSDQVYSDLKKANDLSSGEWRTWNALNGFYLQAGNLENALEISEAAYQQFPDQDAIKMDHARSLLANKRFKACLDHLDEIHILPFEDSREGREIYEKASIFYAAELIENGRFDEALQNLENSMEWPERLGAGMPYDPDHRLQQYAQASVYKRSGDNTRANEIFEKIISYTEQYPNRRGTGLFAGAMALRETGRVNAGLEQLNDWQNTSNSQISRWAIAAYNQNTGQRRELEQQILNDYPANTSDFAMMVRTFQSLNQ